MIFSILKKLTIGSTKAWINGNEIAYIKNTAAIPSGVIVIWSGIVSNIPAGWALCDGNNNTPNLKDKFILGAGDKYKVGDIGGESTHVLTTDEMPSHRHTISNTLSLSSSGSHTHSGVGGSSLRMQDGSGRTYNVAQSGGSSSSAGSHTHSINGSITAALAGSDSAHNNMPPYYVLCFIMKL